MYKGFEIDMVLDPFKAYHASGQALYESNQTEVIRDLDAFLSPDGVLDGTRLQKNWFPNVKADIFISHAHDDQEKAVALAGWIKAKFGLNCFIDSCIWGYANDLLKKIDDVFCANGPDNYSYEQRNFSTSHVHMMLSTALAKMMDRTECLFFLNTPSSISAADTVKKKTRSPWIYAEIATSRVLRKTIPPRLRDPMTKLFAKGGNLNESLRMQAEYVLELDHLDQLAYGELILWEDSANALHISSQHALDALYRVISDKK